MGNKYKVSGILVYIGQAGKLGFPVQRATPHRDICMLMQLVEHERMNPSYSRLNVLTATPFFPDPVIAAFGSLSRANALLGCLSYLIRYAMRQQHAQLALGGQHATITPLLEAHIIFCPGLSPISANAKFSLERPR